MHIDTVRDQNFTIHDPEHSAAQQQRPNTITQKTNHAYVFAFVTFSCTSVSWHHSVASCSKNRPISRMTHSNIARQCNSSTTYHLLLEIPKITKHITVFSREINRYYPNLARTSAKPHTRIQVLTTIQQKYQSNINQLVSPLNADAPPDLSCDLMFPSLQVNKTHGTYEAHIIKTTSLCLYHEKYQY